MVSVVNALEQSPYWTSTAVIVAYDDSDGWYDHQKAPVVNGSFSNQDVLSGTNACGIAGTTQVLPGPLSGGAPVNGRCSPGVRTPLLVISPWAKPNYVDHTLTFQTSIVQFIEQNWNLGTIGGGSYDGLVNPNINSPSVNITNMFDFSQPTPQNPNKPILSPTTGVFK